MSTHRRRVGLVVAVVCAAGALSACGARASSATPRPVPLAAVTTVGTSTWATLAMGDLGQPLDTFWQLFVGVHGRWRLATPLDIATNGGLVATSADGAAGLSGVLPSGDLRFSTVQSTATAGRTWETGVLPAPLAEAPDVLAGLDTRRPAVLLDRARGTVAVGTPGLGGWATVATARTVGQGTASSGCRVAVLDALAATPQGLVVGGACDAGSRLLVAREARGRWELVGPTLATSVPPRVARLVATTTGATVLATTGRAAVALVGSDRLSRWRSSPSLPLGTATLLSSTVAGATVVVVARRGTAAPRAWRSVDARGWTALGALPAGTADIVDAQGTLEALAPRHSVLVVYARDAGGWRVAQRLFVPIAYGSSD